MKKQFLINLRSDIAAQFHPFKNERFTSANIPADYKYKVWWLCSKGHEWEESPYSRCNQEDADCRVCKTSIAVINPKLLGLWHPTKNTDCTPYMVSARSHKKIWWKCPKGDDHEWEAPPYNIARLKNTSGCPICRGFKVIDDNCLAITHPNIATEWDYEKNENLTPYNVTAGSGRKVYWKCNASPDHLWASPIGTRTYRSDKGQGKCPFCQGQKVVASNSLATIFPEVSKEWDFQTNLNTPHDVTPGSSQKVAWICQKDPAHKWVTPVSSRTLGSKPTGCPYCKGKKAAKDNCLATLYPELLKEWDFETNAISPYDVTIGSGRKINWVCKKDTTHRWTTTIIGRTKGTGCPYCQGQKVSLSNCLATLHPELAKEWDSSNQKTPYEVTPGSNDIIIWRCQKDTSHVWEAPVKNRTKGRGCSYCNLGWTVENIRHFVESLIPYLDHISSAGLYVLFQQNGLLGIDASSKGKAFVQALKTGRFPKEELEKFVQGTPSLVDQFLETTGSSLEEDQGNSLEAVENCLSENELNIEADLPTIETKDILAALDSKLFSSIDKEAIDFFIKEAVARIWQHAFSNESRAIEQLEHYRNDGTYPQEVKKLFLSDYLGVKNLQIPHGYTFPHQPNLMQMYTAYLVANRKRLGNWSGTGAGKTLSAVLASRIIGAKLSVICCPNNVINNWERNITAIYPDSYIVSKRIDIRQLQSHQNNFLILNYEFFQQPKAEVKLKALLEECCIDFVIIDEIHYSKQREVEKMSERKRVIASFLSEASARNQNLHILGMSATPVINNLFEGKTLIELVTGVHHNDLLNKPTVSNCISLYQKFVSHGIRWVPQYTYKMNLIKEDIDCSSFIPEIKNISTFGSMVDLEAVLTKAKLPFIIQNLRPKTLVYTHYLKDILPLLQDSIEKAGWRVAVFTGDSKDGLDEFVDGNADVLIASSCVGTGVDRLQHVCNRLIINSLPWTHAEYEQLKGRLYRQGQKKDHVDILVPLTSASINGERWSWCESRWKRIQFKKSIADAAVDGVIPEGHLRTHAQAYKDTMLWLERLDRGEVHEIERKKIYIPLSDEIKQTTRKKLGDLSQMNSQINRESSQTTNQRFVKDQSEWEHYHAVYREDRINWPVIPYQEAIKWFKARPHMTIGDFGCGEALLSAELENKVFSFDHIAINDHVIACDMTHVPLDDLCLDAVVFSLSLMGSNFLDYLKEAHRCLKLDGYLWIAEPTSRFKDIKDFEDLLFRLGFDVIRSDEKWKFTFIKAIKSERDLNGIALDEINPQHILT